MTIVYKVTTKDGITRSLSFTEHKGDPKDYGTKTYVSVTRLDDNENMAYIDARYIIGYRLRDVAENYIKEYYASRLRDFELELVV